MLNTGYTIVLVRGKFICLNDFVIGKGYCLILCSIAYITISSNVFVVTSFLFMRFAATLSKVKIIIILYLFAMQKMHLLLFHVLTSVTTRKVFTCNDYWSYWGYILWFFSRSSWKLLCVVVLFFFVSDSVGWHTKSLDCMSKYL